jgi:hypothetical protein
VYWVSRFVRLGALEPAAKSQRETCETFHTLFHQHIHGVANLLERITLFVWKSRGVCEMFRVHLVQMCRSVRSLPPARLVGLVHPAVEHVVQLFPLHCQLFGLLQNRIFLSSHFFGNGVYRVLAQLFPNSDNGLSLLYQRQRE